VTAYFLDASALCKFYVAEQGSSWIRSVFNATPRHRLFIARITHVEIASALARRVREGALSPSDHVAAFDLFLYHQSQVLRIVEITDTICQRAAVLTSTHALRAYDSVQLACAIEVNGNLPDLQGAGLTFICSDSRLGQAAVDESLKVENPETL